MMDFSSAERPASDAASETLDTAKLRLSMAAMVFLLGYFAVSLRLIDLTLFHTAPTQEAKKEEDVRPLAKPLRGAILDRNGSLIATSLSMASLYADATATENAEQEAKELAAVLPDQNAEDILKKLTSGKHFIWIARDITPRQEYAINALGHPDLGFQAEERRIYPDANLAAHVAGYTDVDGNGIAGIEKSFDKTLAKGDTPVQLSVDLRVQHLLRRALAEAVEKFRAKAGVGVVMDVNTGEIVALVSLPDFDPLHPGDAPAEALFNRASLGVFEMGSTFKLFSTAAALDAGAASFSSQFDATQPIHYGRFTINDYHAKHRPLSVPEIFMYSSNIGTAKMAEALGTQGLKDFYRRLGFFAPVPVELQERGAPLYPRPWRDIDTLTTSFGHGIAVSPLHLVRAAAALVNGGTLVTPTIVKAAKPTLGLKPRGEQVVKTDTSSKVRELLELVVADGTGEKAAVPGYDVGGKTGTAEKNKDGHYQKDVLLSSFLGFFPMNNPRYAVLAMIDEPQGIPESKGFATGGWTAAPVVAQVISELGPLYRIPPDFDTTRDITRDMAVYLKDVKEGKTLASLGADR
jgi:cell division protein FtsI (penicillin-binding protein 3)